MPPLVKKQTPIPPLVSGQPKPAGILGRIGPIRKEISKIFLSLYGRPKVGKTRIGCSLPKPELIIGTEDGTDSVIGTPGLDFVQLLRCEEITVVLDALAKGALRSTWRASKTGLVQVLDDEGNPSNTGDPYESIVLDNGTGFRDMRISEILGLERVAMQKGYGFANRDQWMECSGSMKELLRPLVWMGRQRQYNVVIIAQEQDLAKEGSQFQDFGPAVGKSVADWINAECSYIGQATVREITREQKITIAGSESVKQLGTGKYIYTLRVTPTDCYRAGFRLPNGRKMEQEYLDDPDYDKIMKLIRGK
jgi:hypothetical protein